MGLSVSAETIEITSSDAVGLVQPGAYEFPDDFRAELNNLDHF